MTKMEDYYNTYSPKKRPDLTEFAGILAKPVFQKGTRAYAVRVFSDTYTGKRINPGYYQNLVRADSMSDLRAKLIRNMVWGRSKRFPNYVVIYKNGNIDKYNHAGILQPNYIDRSIFVWDNEVSPYEVKVDARTGALTKIRYEQESNIPYKPKRRV